MSLAKDCFYVDGDNNKLHTRLNGYEVFDPDVIKTYKKGEIRVIVATDHSYDAASQSIAMRLAREFQLQEGVDFFMLDQIIKSGEDYLCDFSQTKDWMHDVIWN
jgi:hypothetical protein